MKKNKRVKTALGILFLGSLGLHAQANELHLLVLSQSAGSIQSKIKFRPWLIAQIRYTPSINGTAPVTGLQYGVSGGDAPAPNKEFGFFAGLRF